MNTTRCRKRVMAAGSTEVAAVLLVLGAFAIGEQLATLRQTRCRSRLPPRSHAFAGWLAMWRLVLSKSGIVRAICGLEQLAPPEHKKDS